MSLTNEEKLELAKRCGASGTSVAGGIIAFYSEELSAYTSAIEEKYQAQIAMLRERDKYYGAPCEYFDDHTKTWISARFIALAFSKVDREPLVQAEKRMPIFGTWNSVRGLDEKGIKAAYALFESSLSDTQATADAFIAEVKARALKEAADACRELNGNACGCGFASQYDCSAMLEGRAFEKRKQSEQGKEKGK